jgi:signal transduction histidine kinase
MLERRLDADPSIGASLTSWAQDAPLVGRMRLALAVAAWLLGVMERPDPGAASPGAGTLALLAYALYSLLLYGACRQGWPGVQGRLPHWLDVGWFALILQYQGGGSSLFFMGFFFAIVTSSYRWGLQEGVRVSMASAAALSLSGLLPDAGHDLSQLLLRSSFVLVMGSLCAHWGETQVRLKQRLAVLGELGRLANPRFGVEHTLAHVLQCLRQFFGAHSCLLVMQELGGQASLRTAAKVGAQAFAPAQPLQADISAQLLPSGHELILHYAQPRWRRPASAGMQSYDMKTGRWTAVMPPHTETGLHLAQWMEAGSFISVPVHMGQSRGRLYVASSQRELSQADALVLNALATQAFVTMGHLDLLDRMASQAAANERQKLSLNLHDTAIQPYIGLKLGLAALQTKASVDNPLRPGLEQLMTMADQVIVDLRRYAGDMRQAPDTDTDTDTDTAQPATVATLAEPSEPAFLRILKQQAAQTRAFYGVDIAVHVDGQLPVNERLSAEVLQVVREGLSNICKHTSAQRGSVHLQCRNGWLGIQISNEAPTQVPLDFTPRSISERAQALGGRAHVRQEADGQTAVHIHIPV